MRHKKSRHLINRFTSWRKATLKSLVRSLIIQESIRTTKAKALAAQPLADKLISLARENSLSAKREAFQILCDHALVSALFKDIGPRFASRSSGYTRVLNLGKRRGDNAEVAILELVEMKKKEIKKPKKEIKQEAKPETTKHPQAPSEEKPKTDVAVKEKPPITAKPTKKFLGGLRGIFKKERDSL